MSTDLRASRGCLDDHDGCFDFAALVEHAGRVTTPPPDPEFRKQARRRSFTSEYRMKIVREADACIQLSGASTTIWFVGPCGNTSDCAATGGGRESGWRTSPGVSLMARPDDLLVTSRSDAEAGCG